MKRRLTIGFITETSNDRFQNEMLSGAHDAATARDMNLIKFALDSVFTNYRLTDQVGVYSDLLKNVHIDGLMFLGYYSDLNDYEKIKRLVKHIPDVPIMSVGRIISGVPSVTMNGADYIRELVRHLIQKHNRKKIVYVCPLWPDDRLGAYVETMQEFDCYNARYILTNEDLNVYNRGDFSNRAEKIISLVFDEKKLPVDAITSMFSYEAIDLIKRLSERGYRIPDDIAITGWEDGDMSKFNMPALTTVYYPFYELGYQGFENLVLSIEGKRIPQVINVPGKLITRRSCGCRLDIVDAIANKIVHKNNDNADITSNKTIERIRESLDLKLENEETELLFHAFIKSISDNDSNDFITSCEQVIDKKRSTEALSMLESDIVALRAAVLPYLSRNTQYLLASDEMWLMVQELIKDKIKQIIGIDDVNKTILSMTIQEIGLDIISRFDLEKLTELLSANLSRIDIPECYLFLFNGNTRLMYAYRGGKPASGKEELRSLDQSSVHEIAFYDDQRHYYLLHMLHVHQALIGFAIFEPGPDDERVYQTLSLQLSSSIEGALTLDKLGGAQTEILKNVKIIEERTRQLERSNKKLEELDDLKNDFIANITHDFRSPLMIILNSSDLALVSGTNGKIETMQARFSTIYDAAFMLRTSIDRLLDIAKMDTQGVKLKVKKIEVRSFLQKLVNFYRTAIKESMIDIIEISPPREIDDLYTDEDKLEEILNNIFSNAIKYCKPEHGEITIELKDKKDAAEIIISDNGIGIPEGQLTAIFDRFYQIEGGRNSKYKGTGIGLAFSKQLAEYLKGSILAESAGPGKGASFILELKKGKEIFAAQDFFDGEPDKESNTRRDLSRLIKIEINKKTSENEVESILTDLNDEENGEFDYQKGIVLIVDDNKQIRNIIKEYLALEGLRNFVTASDGRLGVDAAYLYRPDMIICDYSMPNMRGDEFHDEIAGNPDFKRTPFIFVTAVADKNVILERKRRGALSVLTKPVDRADLATTVELHMKKYMDFKSTLQLATVDELTGLNNRSNLLRLFKARLHVRQYMHLSLIFIDLDHFKKINDRFGHQTGDRILRQVGDTIKKTIRKCDIAGRYGGEELLVLLPDTNIEQAELTAKRIRDEVNRIKITVDSETTFVTASYGIASLVENEKYVSKVLGIKSVEDIYSTAGKKDSDWIKTNSMKMRLVDILIKMVDTALYEAKNSVCKSCRYSSLDSDMFKDRKCPRCYSDNVVIGRDKIVVFNG